MSDLINLKIELERICILKYNRSNLSQIEVGASEMLKEILNIINKELEQEKCKKKLTPDPTQPFPQMKLF